MITPRHLDDPEEFDALAALNRRAERAIAESRRLCEENRTTRAQLVELIAAMKAEIADFRIPRIGNH